MDSMESTLAALERRLDEVEIVSRPFPHWHADSLFVHGVIDSLSARLRDVNWTFAASEFYSQEVAHNITSHLVGTKAEIVGHPALFRLLRAHMERLFRRKMSPFRSAINVHKLRPGHRVGAHTDCPQAPGASESHRLIVYISPDAPAISGGELILFDPNDVDSSALLYEPTNNRAIALEFSSLSWHAVGEVLAGDRYALTYSFWAAEDDTENHSAPTEESGREDVGGETNWPPHEHLHLLEKIGAQRVSHSGRTLLEHLTGTSRILKRWNCDHSVCSAGLFHSLSGTPSFCLFTLDKNLARVRDLAGERAYWLIQFYSAVDVERLCDLVSGHTKEVRGVVLSQRDICALLNIFWANELDQGAHVTLEPGYRTHLAELLSNSSTFLTANQMQQISRILNLQFQAD